MTNIPQNPFPTKEQELLLNAALLTGDEARSAWEKWNTLVDFKGYFDHGSFRLLPLVYRNLSNQKFQHQYIPRLKNVYLQSWYKNQKLFYDSSKILRLFEENNIRTLILKGIPLSILAYKDYGTRPMADLDFLVPLSQAKESIGFLKSNGWQPENDEYIDYNLKYGRSMMFKDQDGFELDLHWYPFFESLDFSSENEFWDRAIPVKLSDFHTLSLCPSDMLLHVIVHGLKWNPEPPVRWIPDSIMLIRNCSDQIDWPYFISQVKKYRVVLQVKEAFQYLSGKHLFDIPGQVTDELRQMPVSFAEKLLYRNAQKADEKPADKLIKKLYQLFLIYLRQSKKNYFFNHIAGFIRFLQFRTAGKNKLKIAWYYTKRGFKKLYKSG